MEKIETSNANHEKIAIAAEKLKAIEGSFKEIDERYKDLMDNSPNIIHSVNAEGYVVFTNAAACKILGYSKDEIIGKHIRDIYAPETWNDMEKGFERLKSEGLLYVDRGKLIKKNGERVDIKINAVAIYDKKGNFVRTRAIITDVTEKRKAEEEIINLAKFPEENPSPVFRISKDGILLYSNKAGMELITALKGKIGGKAPEKFLELVNNNNHNNNRFELNLNERIFSFEIIQIKDKGYNNLYGRDITEKKKIMEVLKESEEKFSKLFNLSPNVNIITTFGEGVILDVNKAFEDELGIPREKVIGKKASDLNFIDPKTRKEAYTRLAKEGLAVAEVGAIVKGQKRFGRVFAKAIEFNGKKCLFQSIIDITEQKLAEEKVKEDEKKIRESLAMSARQNIQLHKLLKEKIQMQEKINQYAKHLETRVETLEKNKIPLTSKEKLVFYGLCAYPAFNDFELSEKLKLKRSTITAIRNRLKEEKWFNLVNIPNFYALGCESFSVLHCNFNSSLKERRDLGFIDEISKMPEIVFVNESNDDSVCLFASKKFVDFQKFINSSLLMKKDVLKSNLNHLSFFFELNIINQFNFASLLGQLFELKLKTAGFQKLSNSKSIADLNHNEKRVLLALIQYPELSIAELSKKIWLSKPTISKIKGELMKNNFVYPLIIPSLRKLSLGLAVMLSLKFEQKFMKKVHMLEPEIEKSDFHFVCKIVGDKELTSLMFFKNREEFEKELIKITEFYRKNDIPLTCEKFIASINKQAHFEKFDMAAITKKLLFPEDF